MTRRTKVEIANGNIFADLHLPDAGLHFLKAQIVSEIYRLAGERKVTQTQVGRRIGISQPEVSGMFKGYFREYSIERLMDFLTAIDRDVEIVIKPHKKGARPDALPSSPFLPETPRAVCLWRERMTKGQLRIAPQQGHWRRTNWRSESRCRAVGL